MHRLVTARHKACDCGRILSGFVTEPSRNVAPTARPLAGADAGFAPERAISGGFGERQKHTQNQMDGVGTDTCPTERLIDRRLAARGGRLGANLASDDL
jgi:hypothetical protein